MNDFFEENKKKIITIGIIILVTIIIGIVNMLMGYSGNNKQIDKARKQRFEEFGTLYYSQFLYPIYKENIKKYKDVGFKVKLYDIAITLDKEIYNIYDIFSDGKKTCDLFNSYLIIYPIESYSENSIKFESNLKCDVEVDKVGDYE